MAHFEKLNNISVENCESFPYYGYQSRAQYGFHGYLEKGLEGLKNCRAQKTFPKYVEERFQKLSDLLAAEEQKTFRCTYGKYHSFNAVATLPPEIDRPTMYAEDLPSYPGVLFDTNRISGNFPILLDEKLVENIYNFYGGSLEKSIIVGGKRNPFFTRINNPSSLIAHEMLHWTGSHHSDKEHLDLVYLSQACCFEIEGVSAEIQDKACKLLTDQAAWQPSKRERLEYLEQNAYWALSEQIIEAYHNQ